MGKRTSQPRKTKGEITRDQIVQAAILLFSREGFSSTSFQQIADACDLSHGAAFKYFIDKNDLIQAVIRQVILNNHRHVSALIQPDDDAFMKLYKYFQGNLRWALEYPRESQVILMLYYFACFNKDFSALYSQIKSSAQARILEFILAGEREGLFKPKIALPILSAFIHDSILGCIVNVVTVTHPKTDKISLIIQSTMRKWKGGVIPILGYGEG